MLVTTPPAPPPPPASFTGPQGAPEPLPPPATTTYDIETGEGSVTVKSPEFVKV
jgi:hypothetical protein